MDVRLTWFCALSDLILLFAAARSALALRCTRAIDATMPIKAPIVSSHAVVVIPLGRRQLRQNPPPEGVLVVPWTCIGTDSVLVHDGLLLSVAVKFTTKVWPT